MRKNSMRVMFSYYYSPFIYLILSLFRLLNWSCVHLTHIEHLLCAKSCSGHWKYKDGLHIPLALKEVDLVGGQRRKQEVLSQV